MAPNPNDKAIWESLLVRNDEKEAMQLEEARQLLESQAKLHGTEIAKW